MTSSSPLPTKAKFSLETDSLAKIRKGLFREPTAAFGARVSSEDLAALTLRCQSHWSRTSLLLNSVRLVFVVSALLGLPVVALMCDSVIEPMPWSGWVAAISFVFLGATLNWFVILLIFRMMCRDLLGLNSAELLEEDLAPLSSTGQGCNTALGLIEKSPKAGLYRDAVVAAGRELRKFDLHILHALKNKDWWIAHHAKNALDCKALHGIPVV